MQTVGGLHQVAKCRASEFKAKEGRSIEDDSYTSLEGNSTVAPLAGDLLTWRKRCSYGLP